jgi:hypothetical protein
VEKVPAHLGATSNDESPTRFDAAEKILLIRNRASKHLDGGDLPKKGADELCREIEAFADELRAAAGGWGG